MPFEASFERGRRGNIGMSTNRDSVEALIRIVGQDGITQLVRETNAGLDEMVDKQRKSNEAAAEQGDAVDESTDRWAMLTTGVNQGLELVGKAWAFLKDVADDVREGAQGLVIDATFAASIDDARAALDGLRIASSGRVSDNVLEQLAIDANRAGLAMADTQRLVAAVTKASALTGQEVAGALKELSKSIAEGTPEGLKQMGVFIDANKVMEEYAATTGKAAAQLTQQEKSTAMLAAATTALEEKFKSVNGTAALDRLDGLSAGWKNLTDTVKETAAAIASASLGKLSEVFGNDLSSEEETFDTVHRDFADRLVSLQDLEVEAHRIRMEIWKAELKAEQTASSESLQQMIASLQTFEALIEKRRDTLEAEAEAERAAAEQRAWDIETYGSMERKAIVEKMAAAQEATRVALEAARVEAELAQQFLDTGAAADKFATWLRLGNDAQIDLIASTDLMTQTLRPFADQLDSLAANLLLQAEMAELAGDAIEGYALRAQAADLASGQKPKSDAPEEAKRSGGGRDRHAEDMRRLEAEQRATLQTRATLREAEEKMRMELAQLDREQEAELFRQQMDDMIARQDEERATLEAHMEEMQRLRQEGFDSMAEAARSFVGTMGEVDGIRMDNLPGVIQQLGPLADHIDAMRMATDKSQGAMVKGATGIAAASGQMVASLVEDQTAQAAIMMLVETARGFGAIATYQYPSAAAHFAAAGIYGVVAGMSAAGGGGGGGGGRAAGGMNLDVPAAFQPTEPRDQQQSVTYQVYVNGAILGPGEAQLERDLERILHSADRRRSSSSGDAAPR